MCLSFAPHEQVQQRTAEQIEDEETVVVMRFAPR